MFKVLNLYAGIGGNRKNWAGVEVTSVELDPQIAAAYRDMYPKDTVLVEDAHEYLRTHYKEYDFIWSSPPCQTHASLRQNLAVRFRGTPAVYPDMRLYQEIIFLRYNFSGLFVVENVSPYYKVLIPPTVELHRHLFWSNFTIEPKKFVQSKIRSDQIPELQERLGIDVSKYRLPDRRQVLRNCILPELGEHILAEAFRSVIQ